MKSSKCFPQNPTKLSECGACLQPRPPTVIEKTPCPYTPPKYHICQAALSCVHPFPHFHGEDEKSLSGFLTQLSPGDCRGIKPGFSMSRETPAHTAAVSRPGLNDFPREKQNEIQAVRGFWEWLTCSWDVGRLWDETRLALVDGTRLVLLSFPRRKNELKTKRAPRKITQPAQERISPGGIAAKENPRERPGDLPVGERSHPRRPPPRGPRGEGPGSGVGWGGGRPIYYKAARGPAPHSRVLPLRSFPPFPFPSLSLPPWAGGFYSFRPPRFTPTPPAVYERGRLPLPARHVHAAGGRPRRLGQPRLSRASPGFHPHLPGEAGAARCREQLPAASSASRGAAASRRGPPEETAGAAGQTALLLYRPHRHGHRQRRREEAHSGGHL